MMPLTPITHRTLSYKQWLELTGEHIENMVEYIYQYMTSISLYGYSFFVNKAMLREELSSCIYKYSSNKSKKQMKYLN